MTTTPRRTPATLDGATSRSSRRKSEVSEVQDPQIAGDAGKDSKVIEAGEVVVDEAGQARRKNNNEVDLLH